MKSQFIFIGYICYTFLLYSECNDESNQPLPQQIHITFNANTDAYIDQNNNIDQNAKHKSSPKNLIDTNITMQDKDHKQLQKLNLKPTVSQTNYVIRNSVKLFGVYLMASEMAHAPFLFPTYMINRFVVYPCVSDSPWFDAATEEEAAELAQEGKYKIPEPIIYPIAHHIYKAITK